jgi:hypothetical protein
MPKSNVEALFGLHSDTLHDDRRLNRVPPSGLRGVCWVCVLGVLRDQICTTYDPEIDYVVQVDF